ncbi:MAG: DUF3800 domain-containing protein [Patescibacteria group bacterium]|nr:DUF3800 domain-containing protein [Patescibacteria group bacterium]
MKRISIFIDESGTLPDPRDEVVIVAAAGTEDAKKIEGIIKFLRRKGKLKDLSKEIKFYSAGEKTKRLFLQKVVEEGLDIFVLIVEKAGKKIPDTPENFAFLCWLLLNDVFSFYSDPCEIILDRHFSRVSETEEFNRFLPQLLHKSLVISHVDSAKNRLINVADMVAGAVLAKETKKNFIFYEIIRERIIREKRLNWKEVKRRVFQNKKLARTGASTHPKQVS